jgi:hypothetical protein
MTNHSQGSEMSFRDFKWVQVHQNKRSRWGGAMRRRKRS